MRLSVPTLAAFSLLASSSQALVYFSIPLGGGSAPAAPAPVAPPPNPYQCNAATLSFKPLGSWLFGPLFPNPWSGIHIPLNIPNCQPAPPPPPPCPQGQSCQLPPVTPYFPGQAAADAQCAAVRGSLPFPLKACLDISGVSTMCCAG